MARAATSPEITLYRSPGKASKFRAAIFQPTVVYTARINQTFSTLDGILEITYDGGVGTLDDVVGGMTLFIGSSPGDWDIGIVRLREKDAIKFYIGETSDIRFADNQYLTVVNDFGLWARHVLISAGESYMDGGIAYSDQHSVPDPTPIMGTNRVLKLTGASVSASFDASDSYVIDGSAIDTFAWIAIGASAASGLDTATPTITWDAPGWYLVYLVLTAENGKSFFGVRYVYIWDDDHLPPRAQIGNARQDVESGGWEFDLTLTDTPDLDTIRDHALVIVFSEDYFDGTQSDIGPVSGAENIELMGWIAKEEINWNPEQGFVRFTAYGAHYWLSQIPAFPDGVEFVTSAPSAWTQFQNLTVDKGLWHFLHWRTTATRILDVFLSGDTKYTTEVSSLASNLWEQIREMAFLQIYARAGVNAWNQLFVEVHPQLVPLASRTWPTVLAITEKDWQREITFERITKPECAVVSLSGVAVNSSGVGASFFSLSPGHAYPHYGSIDVQDRLLVADQAQANQLAGLYRGWRNNPYPEIPIALAADIRLIDCFPRAKCAMVIDAADTPRGISFSGNLLPTAVSIVTDPETGYVHREVTFEAETFEDLSMNGDIPGGRGDVSTPPTPKFPPLSDFPVILPGTVVPSAIGPTQVLLHDTVAGLIYTENFDAGSPIWTLINPGLSGLNIGGGNALEICPNGAVYFGFIPPSDPGTDYFLARAPSIGATFVPMSLPARLRSFAINPLVSEQVGFSTGNLGDAAWLFHVGTAVGFSTGANVVDFGSPSCLSYGFGAWVMTRYLSGGTSVVKLNAAGSSIVAATGPNASPNHLRAGTTSIIYCPENAVDALLKSEDNFATSSDVCTGQTVTLAGGGHDPLYGDCDPSGMVIMTRALVGQKAISNDGGVSWSPLPSLPVGNWHFRYAGPGDSASHRFIAVSGGAIRYTPDGGTTWINKEGNITSVVPLPALDLIRVLTP